MTFKILFEKDLVTIDKKVNTIIVKTVRNKNVNSIDTSLCESRSNQEYNKKKANCFYLK